jgi:hypothetical protein
MTYKLKLNQVRQVLGMEVKLEAIKLLDGTMLEVEKLEPGFPVFVIAEDGTMTPAPMGEHTLEDGTTIELDNAGMIVEVSAKEEDVIEAEEAEEDVIEVSGEETKVEEKVDVAMEDIAEIVEEKVEEKFKTLFEVIEEVAMEVAGIKEEMGAMKTKMEKFSKAPAAGAAPKMTAASDKLDAFDAKLEFIKSLKK